MTQKQKQAAIDAAVAYNKTLVLNDARFTPTEEQLATYNSLLDADGLGMMGYIVIPKISCKLSIHHTVNESVLQVGVGHLEGLAYLLEVNQHIVSYQAIEVFQVPNSLQN